MITTCIDTQLTGTPSIILVIDLNKLDKVEKDANDEDKKVVDAVAHKYRWAFIVAAGIFTLIALMSFFG